MAMWASGDRNPNATRVSTRIFVFVDSTRALEVPDRRAASMALRCRRILRASSTKAGMLTAAGPGQPVAQQGDALFALEDTDVGEGQHPTTKPVQSPRRFLRGQRAMEGLACRSSSGASSLSEPGRFERAWSSASDLAANLVTYPDADMVERPAPTPTRSTSAPACRTEPRTGTAKAATWPGSSPPRLTTELGGSVSVSVSGSGPKGAAGAGAGGGELIQRRKMPSWAQMTLAVPRGSSRWRGTVA